MAVPIRTSSHRDPVGQRMRRRTLLRRWILAGGAVTFCGGLLWLTFWSSFLSVTTVHIEGGGVSFMDTVQGNAWEFLDMRRLYVFQPARNMVLLDGASLTQHLLAAMPSLASVSVVKDYPHRIVVRVAERIPFGIWCAQDRCQYIDRTGAQWGDAPRSRGTLLLLIDDQRGDTTFDPRLFAGIIAATDQLPEAGIRIAWVVLPDAAPGDMTIRTDTGFDLRFNAFGDMEDQLTTLAVFLADRIKDTAFHPQYIDLRTPGRVYYR